MRVINDPTERRLVARFLEADDDSPRPTSSLASLSSALLTSLWQKSIRRSDLVWASRCAAELSERDPDYAWRRIRVIALEDVGLGDIELVASVLAVAGKRALHRRHGEARSLRVATRLLAEAPKSRAACDIVTLHSAMNALHHMGSHESSAEGLRMNAIDSDLPLWLRYDVTRRICGFSSWGQGAERQSFPVQPDVRDELLEEINAPAELRLIVHRGRDSYGLAPALLTAFSSFGRCHVYVPPCRWHDESPGVPSFAYCMYTPDGRRAIRSWLREDQVLRTLVSRVQPVDEAKAVGLAVFQVEGSLLAREWISEGSSRLKREAEAAELLAAGFSYGDAIVLREVVKQRIHVLNRARDATHAAGGVK